MKHLKIIITLLAFNILFGGCKKETLLSYDLRDGIGFYKNGMTEGRDSLLRSFAVLDLKIHSDTIVLPLRILGRPKDFDREVSYSIDDKLTTAVREEYTLLRAYVPANSFEGELSIRVNRTERLKNQNVKIALTLEASADFESSPKELRTYLINLNDYLTKPASWDDIRFGEYSQVKYGMIIRETGYHNFADLHPDIRYYIISKCRLVLRDYINRNQTEMLDENNVPVRFP